VNISESSPDKNLAYAPSPMQSVLYSCALQLFDRIKDKYPGMAEEKLVPVAGDLSDIRLGLTDADYDVLMRNVSIVFHVAATVRFDEPFRDAVIKNVRGTREVVRLAKQMKFLKVSINETLV